MNRQRQNGRHRRDGARSPFLGLVVLGLSVAFPLYADELDDLLLYARAGAPHLAAKLIEQRQPDKQADLQGWLRWEHALLGLLRDNQD